MALTTLENFEKETYEDLNEKRRQLDKLVFFCKRSLTKKLNSFKKPLIYWELLTYLLTIGHGYFYLNDYYFAKSTIRKKYVGVKNKPKKLSKEIKDYFSEVINYFDLLYQAMYKKDVKIISRMKNLSYRLSFEWPELMLEKSKENAPVIAKLMYQVRIIQLTTGTVFYLIHDED